MRAAWVVAVACGAWPALDQARIHVAGQGSVLAADGGAPINLDDLAVQTLSTLHARAAKGVTQLARMREQAPHLDAGQADRYFEMDLALSESPPSLTVTVGSMQRAADIHGSSTVLLPGSGEDAVRSALVQGAVEAFADLRDHLDDDHRRPRMVGTLVLDESRLSPAQRAIVDGPLVACALKRIGAMEDGPRRPEPAGLQMGFIYRIRMFDPSETEAAFLKAAAGRLITTQFELANPTCGVQLQGISPAEVEVDVDVASHALRVRF